MGSIDKGLGTLALWLGICVAITVFGNVGILSSFGATMIMIGGFLTTSYIWIDSKAMETIDKMLKEKEKEEK